MDHATVVRLLELLGEAMEGVRAGADARTRLELALVKAARPETDGSTRALLARIERLERGAGAAIEPQPGPPRAPAPESGPQPDPAPEATPEPAPQAVRDPAPAATPDPDPAPDPTPDRVPEAMHEPAPEPVRDRAPEPVSEPLPRDIESVYALWPAVVDLVRSEHALLGAVIGEARPVAVDGDELTLAYPFTAEFYKKKAEDPANRAAVGEALGALAGGRWKLRYELRDSRDRRTSRPRRSARRRNG